jgi:uncharacterized protein (DUF1810 family)
MTPSETSLNRFTKAQQTDYERALTEIKNGKKRSHWMWYIFPQIQGLGFSEMARFYSITNKGEAEQYLKHPVLGSRLIEISNALLHLDNNDAHYIFGSPDDMKLQSSMTLFASLQNADPVFMQVLDKFYKGEKDKRTLDIIGTKE